MQRAASFLFVIVLLCWANSTAGSLGTTLFCKLNTILLADANSDANQPSSHTEKAEGPPLSKSVKVLIKAAEQGDAEAQFNLAGMYLTGEGVQEDYGKAVHWYSKAAEQGDVRAQGVLAMIYDMGIVVEQDYGKAPRPKSLFVL